MKKLLLFKGGMESMYCLLEEKPDYLLFFKLKDEGDIFRSYNENLIRLLSFCLNKEILIIHLERIDLKEMYICLDKIKEILNFECIISGRYSKILEKVCELLNVKYKYYNCGELKNCKFIIVKSKDVNRVGKIIGEKYEDEETLCIESPLHNYKIDIEEMEILIEKDIAKILPKKIKLIRL